MHVHERSRPEGQVPAGPAGAVGLLAVAALALVVGVVGGLFGEVVDRTVGRLPEQALVSPTDPGTIAPPVTAATVPVEPATTAPMATVAVTSARPPAVTVPAPPPVAPPVRLSVPALGLDAVPVTDVGLLPSGSMEVPDVSLIGWYRYSSAPGDTGTAVLAGHVALGGRNGLFVHLDRLQTGDPLVVRHADGREQSWVVVAVEQHDKEALPAERLFTRNGSPKLALITCGGEFLWDARSYRDNIVVFAEPAGPPTTPSS